MRLVNCIVCGVEFRADAGRACLCSQACRDERRRECNRRDKLAHPEREREWNRRKKQTEKGREKNREAGRRHRERGGDEYRKKHREAQRAWRAANPERVREIKRRTISKDYKKYLKRGRQSYQRRRDKVREHYLSNVQQFREKATRYSARYSAAVKLFRKLISPCSYKDRVVAYQTLQQLGRTEP